MTTLEQLLKKKVTLRNGTIYQPDFRVTIQTPKKDGQHILIHRMQSTKSDDTLEFIVKGDKLIPYNG